MGEEGLSACLSCWQRQRQRLWAALIVAVGPRSTKSHQICFFWRVGRECSGEPTCLSVFFFDARRIGFDAEIIISKNEVSTPEGSTAGFCRPSLGFLSPPCGSSASQWMQRERAYFTVRNATNGVNTAVVHTHHSLPLFAMQNEQSSVSGGGGVFLFFRGLVCVLIG